MARKRRSNRLTAEEMAAAREEQLNQYVAMFLFDQVQPDVEDWETWELRSVTLRIAREMVAAGEAEALRVFSQDNGWLMVFRETKPFEATATSPTSLSHRTSEAAAADRTGAKLSGRERRELANYLLHPWSHDTKAPLVGNRVDAAHLARAKHMIAGRPAQALHSRRDAGVRTLRPEATAA